MFLMTDEQKLRLRYQIALNQFRRHPPMVWTRNNFFLLIQAGLLAFTINQNSPSDTRIGGMAYFAGLLVALIWLWVTYAGQKLLWEWRHIVIVCEKDIFTKPDMKGPFHLANEKGEEGKGWHITRNITLALKCLSGGFVLMWLVLIYFRYFEIVRNYFGQ
jgi:hypothetical protein